MMKVVHFSETPLSSAPYRLMQVQRAGGIDARLIMHKHRYTDTSEIVHPYDILLQDERSNHEKREKGLCFDIREITRLIVEADVLHFHNFLDDHFLFRLYPGLRKQLENKKVVYQVHSPRRFIPHVSKKLKDKRVNERLVIAQYQARQFPECEVVPNAVPINDPNHTPIEKDIGTPAFRAKEYNSIPRICYSPSNTKLKGWNNKGHDEVMMAMKNIKLPHELVVIQNTPFEECLRIKQSCDICIDEVVTGSYHMSTLEAMSQGLAVINNIDEECEKTLNEWTNTGVGNHPMIKANAKTLTKKISELLINRVKLREHQSYSRAFMETHWNTEKICKKFMEIYSR
jgi:hypothetical protein